MSDEAEKQTIVSVSEKILSKIFLSRTYVFHGRNFYLYLIFIDGHIFICYNVFGLKDRESPASSQPLLYSKYDPDEKRFFLR